MEDSNKQKLIDDLIGKGYLRTGIIIEAFKNIDRKDFVLPQYQVEAYRDEALPIGYGQTISQPLTVAFMLELLEPQPGDRILDVGSGSAWTTALLAHIVSQTQNKKLKTKDRKRGGVIGVEKKAELVEFGRRNLAKYHFKNAKILPSGKELGLPMRVPSVPSRAEGFDRILVSAAANELPEKLIEQLKIGGRMVIPIRNSIWKIDRVSEKKVEKEEYYGFRFVPLVETFP